MRWRSPHLVLFFFLAFLVGEATVSGFKICAYNVQKFNFKKASNLVLMHTLTRILSRCDICLLQEVMDPDGKAIKALLSSLNRYDSYTYKSVSSKSLGNDPKDMQQYVFIYSESGACVCWLSTSTRSRTPSPESRSPFTLKATKPTRLTFALPPFVLPLSLLPVLVVPAAIRKFILVPLHTNPNTTVQEIDRLYDVFVEVRKKWDNENVMFLGDFHASCAYMTRNDKKDIRLFKSEFIWLIGDREDTTVPDNTNCAYDRIVVHGKSFLEAISPFSARVFNFGKLFKLSKSKVVKISNHYPVEVKLKSSALLLQATPLLILLAIVQSFLSAL
ncbi:hypothetical protein L3Q82_016280 [Scortum barcoo]|uniref:Uncharacterized protein n=1 Tax=Scortum barcoo TaxID=214431 RepID=A0ACB8VQZ9_9TELE|nr:hypothetical protein L3Q82_016280 [Scortum barcoo]